MVGRTDDQSQAILQLLVDCATVGIGFLDHQPCFRYLNPTLALINSAAPDELVGRPLVEVAPRAASLIVEHCRHVLASGGPVMNVEYTRPAAAGGPARTWLADFIPIRGLDQAIIGVGLIVIDITERRLASAARDRPADPSVDDLQSILRDAQAYTHRLNNQLALAVGYGELLAAGRDLDKQAREYLGRVVTALNEVGQTVANLQNVVHRG